MVGVIQVRPIDIGNLVLRANAADVSMGVTLTSPGTFGARDRVDMEEGMQWGETLRLYHPRAGIQRSYSVSVCLTQPLSCDWSVAEFGAPGL